MFENYDKAKCHEENQMARDNLFLKQSSFYEVEHRNFRPFPSCLAGERELPFSEYTNSAEPKNSDSLSHRPRALDSSLALGPDKLFDDRANGFGTDTLIKMNECGINLFAMDQGK